MSEYFPRSKSLWVCKKADLKNATGDDTSDFAWKTDLANLKFELN